MKNASKSVLLFQLPQKVESHSQVRDLTERVAQLRAELQETETALAEAEAAEAKEVATVGGDGKRVNNLQPFCNVVGSKSHQTCMQKHRKSAWHVTRWHEEI